MKGKGKTILTGVVAAAAFAATLIDSLELLPRAPVPGEIPGEGRPELLAAVAAALLAAGGGLGAAPAPVRGIRKMEKPVGAFWPERDMHSRPERLAVQLFVPL